MLREPELLHAIVRAVRAATPAQVPVTAKMRLGYDDTALALDCAQALATAGAAEIVVHARTKTEGYRPPAHWDWIARIREAVTVNVVANGEIWTLQDAQRCLEISGSQDLMLGVVWWPVPIWPDRLPAGQAAALRRWCWTGRACAWW